MVFMQSMKQLTRRSVQLLWDGIEMTRSYRLFRPWYQGRGTIVMLHRVRPEPERSRLYSNRTWEVTPEHLEAAIEYFEREGYAFASLSEMKARLDNGSRDAERFVCFTLDDGYADNSTHAYPIFKARRIPFCIYVATCYPDGNARMLGLSLEAILLRTSKIELSHSLGRVSLTVGDDAEKLRAVDELRKVLDRLSVEESEDCVLRLAKDHGVDIPALRKAQSLSWHQLSELSRDPLVTIGAHTVHHPMLAKLSREEALSEMTESKARLEKELSRQVEHFAYPYGHPASTGQREFQLAREAGFSTAVTTNIGNVYTSHRELVHALPRINLDGHEIGTGELDKAVSGFHFARARQWSRRPLPLELQ
jgi:peptidoglycan/xylan/chitin deacetylase (PgdA/CDA1 family)